MSTLELFLLAVSLLAGITVARLIVDALVWFMNRKEKR